jgi:hypothetical protein
MPTPREAQELFSRAQAKKLLTAEERRRSGIIDVPDPTVSGLQAAGESALIKFIDDFILGLPQGAGEFLAQGAGAIEAIGPKTLDEAIQGQRENFPAAALAAIPRVRVEDIVPGQKERQELAEEQQPGAVRGGKIAGDIIGMLGLRAPFAKKLAARKPPPVPISGPAGVPRLMDRAFKHPATQKLLRGAGRAGEAGFEGAVLGVLSEGDPVELAAFGAGAQMANSAILEAGKGLFSGGVLKSSGKIGVAAFSVGALIQMLKTVTPGGKNFILESLETGFEKMAAALILGAGSALAGGGRVRASKFAEDLPFISDAITAIPRNGLLATIKEYGQVDELSRGDIEAVMLKIVQDPKFFDPSTNRQLDRAIRQEDISFVETIERLKKDKPAFRDKLKRLRG